MRGCRGLTQRIAGSVADRRGSGRRLLYLLPALAGLAATPAAAQVAGNVSLASADMFRGETLSGNDPALSVAVNIDHSSGLFAGASITAAAGDRDPRITSATQYAGYALRKGETSLEVGVIHRDYGEMFDPAYRKHYFEGFVGVSHRSIRARIYVSPDYLQDGRTTYYGEVNVKLLQAGKWSLNAHAGLSLIPADLDAEDQGMQDYEDWSVQISRPVGKFSVSLGVSGTNYPVFSENGRAKVFAVISRSF